MAGHVTRTTLTLPTKLLEQVDDTVCAGKIRGRNAFVAEAIRRELAAQEEAEIDAAFALMAEDEEYLAESDRINEEFAIADWEAFQLGESSA
ncbi:MAG: CopG family transcriptional regulator [Thermomicrobiales bacterium]